jgi:hypothetical protein
MEIKTGSRYRSQVDSTEVIVVRAKNDDVDLECGGVSMVTRDTVPADGLTIVEGQNSGTQLGKRYVREGYELLVTKAGEGTLAISGHALDLKEAKPLPSSD